MFVLTLLLVQPPAEPPDVLARKMLPVYVREAGEYTIAVASAPDKRLERKPEPVFDWSNPVRSGLQQGVIYVWLRDGRPAAIGSFWSQPEDRKIVGRKVYHEFHALDPERLVVTRPAGALNGWKPQAGLARSPLPDAGTPAATPAARLAQMRKLAQEFTGHSIDEKKDRDGMSAAVPFANQTRTGLQAEAWRCANQTRRPQGLCYRLQLATRRLAEPAVFDFLKSVTERKDKEVWSSVLSETNTRKHDMLDLYRAYSDKIVDVNGKVLARVRVTDKVWWGEVIPVNEK